MSNRSEELLFNWLDQAARRLARLNTRHGMAVDLGVALLLAVVSLAGLHTQNRLGPESLAFCLALCAPLLLLRRAPLRTFALIAAVAFAQWLTSVPQLADAAVLLALWRVALESSLAEAALAAVIAETGAVLAAVRWSPSAPVKIWVGLSGLAVAAGVLGITVRQRRALLASLQEKAQRLEAERDQQGRLAAAAERARIAREMHDIVSHNLTVMIALADGAAYIMDSAPERAAPALARVSATGRQALAEMRRLLGVLRDDPTEQPLEPQPSLERLDELLNRVQAAGVPVTCEVDGAPGELPEGVQLAVFRVAQEALTNTLKHAPRPTAAHVSLRCHGGEVELDVSNRGAPAPRGPAGVIAADGAPDGRGLRGMRERAAAYGGQLQAGPAPEGGWRVCLRLNADVAAPAR